MAVKLVTRDLVGKTVWHWQLYYSVKGRQILATSRVGRSSVIRYCPAYRTLDMGGLTVPDDLPCAEKKDRVEIDMGDAHVILRIRG